MFSPHGPVHHHKNARFYIVIITLLVGAIFLFLFMNNNTEGVSLTSAFVGGDSEEGNLIANTGNTIFSGNDKTNSEDEETTRKVSKDFDDIKFSLEFDQIPEISKESKLEEIELTFEDLSTKINVNNDHLELNNLKEVKLKVEDFEGLIDFNNLGVSVDGTAKRIAVNDIALSSRGEIKISFDDLDYKSLSILGLELKQLDLSEGDGKVSVNEKLEYALENEEVSLYKFIGKMSINRDGETQVSLEGDVNSITVTGEELTLNLN